ncbi:hypothetical protein P2G88_01280 [Aliiglaciecola sp. CAU 1673]|uniref:ABC transporter permease n=1 Tax=Aliiglaciecola sp. CAU 1673 TaxID=3032595 RepID=UPI0023DC384B|nr:FtsX-like permease family protein [Aliiglaciecola sp. CAU 1673]MDF2176883.1 hypothetical protein [Aliiglaciecola sp. CAU 1673]
MSLAQMESGQATQTSPSANQGVKRQLLGLTLAFLIRQTRQKQNLVQLLTLALLFFYLSFITLVGSGAQQFLQANLQELLGADSVLHSFRPLPQESLSKLQANVTKLSETRSIELSLTHKPAGSADKPLAQWTQLKLVDNHYPVHGQVQISTSRSLLAKPIASGPALGEIWLEPRLASALGINLGDTLMLGDSRLRFSALLLGEPDRLLEGHSSEMRAMVTRASLEGFLQVKALKAKDHRYLIAHDPQALEALKAVTRQHSDFSLISQALGNHPLAGLWQRVEKFTGLVTVLLVVLGAIILTLSNQSVMAPIRRFCAICLANGMARRHCYLLAVTGSAFMLLISLVPSVLLAVMAAEVSESLLGALGVDLRLDWQVGALLKALLMAGLLFLCLTLPAWLRVALTPTRSLLNLSHQPKGLGALSIALPLVAVAALVLWYSDNWSLTTFLLTTLVACLALLVLLTWVVLGLGKWTLTSRAHLLGFALYLMQKRIWVKGAQIIALGLSLTLLLLCARISQDVTDVLEQLSYRDQGNLIVSRVDEVQKQALTELAQRHQGKVNPLFAYQYAQLTHINAVPLKDTGLSPSESLSHVARPVRLHWRDKVPGNNRLQSGQWQAGGNNTDSAKSWPVSVEQEVFEDLGLHLGDTLSMQLGEQQVQLQVASTHNFVAGGSLVTFWFVRQADSPVKGADVWYMGDMDLSEAALASLGELWQSHPGMRLVPVETLLSKTRLYLNILVGLVLTLSLFMALLSNLLMAAAIQLHMQQDATRNALILSFGLANKARLKLIAYEWGIITLLPAIAATACVYFSMQAFYTHELGMPYQANFWILSLEATLMALGIASAGMWMTRRQLKQPVRQLFSEQ